LQVPAAPEIPLVVSEIVLRMVGNNGPEALRAAIVAPEWCAIEPRLRVVDW
jgi:hypothetical protein